MPARKMNRVPKIPVMEIPAETGRQRSIQLNDQERAILSRNRLLQDYIDLLLDTTKKWTYEEMTEKLNAAGHDITVRYLKEHLNKDDDFIRAYEARKEAMSSSVRLSAVQEYINEIAGEAVDTLRRVMKEGSYREQREAAVALLQMAGFNGQPKEKTADSGSLRKFLEGIGIQEVNVTNISIGQLVSQTVPDEYQKALAEITVVDAEIVTENTETKI